MALNIDMGETKLSTHLGVMSNEITMEYMGMTNKVDISGVLMENEMKINLPGKFENKIEVDAGTLITQMKMGGLRAGFKSAALILEAEQAVKAKNDSIELKKNLVELCSGELKLDSSKVGIVVDAIHIIS
jgi:hypothetical protein